MVDWHPTLIAEHSLGYTKELVDKFEARLRAQYKVKNGRKGSDLKRGEREAAKADALSSREKKLQGRPRNLVELDD
jgi:hypothetical protein